MPPLSLPLSKVFRNTNKDSLQRLAIWCSALHTDGGIWSLGSNRSSNKANYLEVTSDSAPSARTARQLWGRWSAPSMCYSSISSEERTSWLWSAYNETKSQTKGNVEFHVWVLLMPKSHLIFCKYSLKKSVLPFLTCAMVGQPE